MALTLWRRHSEPCRAKLLAKGILVDQVRFYRKCNCACWVTGVHPATGEYLKQSLKTTSWETGEKLKARIEEAARPGGGAVTVKDALDSWLAEKVRTGTAATTLNNFEVLQRRIMRWSDGNGYVLMSQLTEERVYDFVAGWRSAASTNKYRLERLREFFRYALQRKWVETNLASPIASPRVVRVMADPFTPDQELRIDSALEVWTSSIQAKLGAWSTRPATLRCLVHVLRDTGLRVSDAQRIRPAILEPITGGAARTTISQMKNDSKAYPDVTVYLSADTVREISQVPWLSETHPFLAGPVPAESSRDAFKLHVRRHGANVYNALTRIGQVAGIEDLRPHRFRHTFAVKRLLDGWSLEDVQRLLGHGSIRTTERHYAKWVPARQARLEAMVLHEWQQRGAVIEMRKKLG